MQALMKSTWRQNIHMPYLRQSWRHLRGWSSFPLFSISSLSANISRMSKIPYLIFIVARKPSIDSEDVWFRFMNFRTSASIYVLGVVGEELRLMTGRRTVMNMSHSSTLYGGNRASRYQPLINNSDCCLPISWSHFGHFCVCLLRMPHTFRRCISAFRPKGGKFTYSR